MMSVGLDWKGQTPPAISRQTLRPFQRQIVCQHGQPHHVTSSGITVWLARRRDKGRAAPVLERIWKAICWGHPVAIITTAPIALLFHDRTPDGALVMVWAAVALLLAILASALTAKSAADLARPGRIMTGLLLLVSAGLHAVMSMGGAVDLAGSVIDTLAVAAAIVLLRAIPSPASRPGSTASERHRTSVPTAI